MLFVMRSTGTRSNGARYVGPLDGSSLASLRRYAEVGLVTIVWSLAGWLLELDSSAYLVLGIPIVAFFQIFVRRQSLPSLWVKESPPFKLNANGVICAVALAILPAANVLGAIFPTPRVSDVLWYLSGLPGAVAAAYALVRTRREHLRPLLLCLVINEVIDGLGWFLLVKMGAWSITERSVAERFGVCALNTLLYVPLFFMTEEVAFRGAFDAHLGAGLTNRWWLRSSYVSALWVLWHVPLYRPADSGDVVALAIIWPFGLVLSYAWRKTGNLGIPVISHALSDGLFLAFFG